MQQPGVSLFIAGGMVIISAVCAHSLHDGQFRCESITSNTTCKDVEGCAWCLSSCYNASTSTCCNLPNDMLPNCGGVFNGTLCPIEGKVACVTTVYNPGNCMVFGCCEKGDELCGTECFDPKTHQCCEYPNPHPKVAPLNATCCTTYGLGGESFCLDGDYCCGADETICCRNGTKCNTDRYINHCF